MWGVHCTRFGRRRPGRAPRAAGMLAAFPQRPADRACFRVIKRGLIMRQVRILAALGLLVAAAAANAEVSSTWTLTSDYDFRGFSQSETGTAFTASDDHALA